MTKTQAEKLEEIFNKKLNEFDRAQKWIDYLAGLDGVEQIRKFSNYENEVGYLLEHINASLPFDKFVIRIDSFPTHPKEFVIIDKEVALKILAIGLP
jgi:SPX domain protein involved in polyphosphate accumulation